MAEETSRRRFLAGMAAAAAAAPVAAAAVAGARLEAQQQTNVPRSADHHFPNEEQPGPNNTLLEKENPNSVWSPITDDGSVPPFKYPFDMAHKEIDKGGWTRQVTVRELAVSKTMAGVEMRLVAGGIRELHWHVSGEWALMIAGSARITAVDAEARSFVNDVKEGDLWFFPGGVPHSIQGLGPDGCKFLLVFNQGDFDEFSTFLLSDMCKHIPKEVLAKNFNTPEATFDNLPKEKLYIFPADLPRGLAEEQKEAAAGTSSVNEKFVFRPAGMKPSKESAGGEIKIIDKRNFPASDIASVIVRVKPGGLRELNWHPLADEWQYYVSGKGRMTIFEAGGKARTEDFEEGDVGYVSISRPHYIENTGTEDLVFLEMFPTPIYQDISAMEWLAHTPTRLVDEHLHTGEEFLKGLAKKEAVVVPL